MSEVGFINLLCTKMFGIKPIKILDWTEYFRRKSCTGFHNSQVHQNPSV